MRTALRKRLVEAPGSVGEKARTKRAEHFVSTFPRLDEMKVLDLGGTRAYWERLPLRPLQVTAVNTASSALALSDDPDASAPWFHDVVGDACDPPDEILSESFDLVFSNSTIEHVGDADRRKEFAAVVHASAALHWVQTPNRAFPIEPHVLFPLEQFLPTYGKAVVHRYWPLVHSNAKTMDAAVQATKGTELLGRTEFETLFPGSRIEGEDWWKFVPAKSLIAVRDE